LALDVLLGAAPDAVTSNVVLSGIAGAFAGVAIAMTRSLRRNPGSAGKSFISALFSKGLGAPSPDGALWSGVLLGAAVGSFVGALTGAAGFISFPQTISGHSGDAFAGTLFPLTAFLGGGFGGPGGTHFGSLLFLALVVIMTALLVGLSIGFLVHLAIYNLAGATAASTQALILRALQGAPKGGNRHQRHPLREGAIRGALTGALVGLTEAAFTVWGVANFYHPPVS
jgi:hypothetical protein